MARQIERVPERVGRVTTLRDGRQIEYGHWQHEWEMGATRGTLNVELNNWYQHVAADSNGQRLDILVARALESKAGDGRADGVKYAFI